MNTVLVLAGHISYYTAYHSQSYQCNEWLHVCIRDIDSNIDFMQLLLIL